MITLDGSFGEGGGQVLRTSLALSLTTGKSFSIENIRANRKKPGLMRQHLTALNAAAEVGNAEVDGDILGSQEVSFEPGPAKCGSYHFVVGTAGSATLVLQTVLPVLLTAASWSDIIIEGGTHNAYAPPFDFISGAFLPIIERMGPKVTARLDRYGFYPAGGGKFRVSIRPVEKLRQINIDTRGDIVTANARALVSKLASHIAERELNVIKNKLPSLPCALKAEEIRNSPGPGNILLLEIDSEYVSEVFAGFGKRGLPAEKVAEDTAEEVREYLNAGVPVGKHLADQLLVPMALAGGGKFKTLKPTLHTETNMEIVQKFLDVNITTDQISDKVWEIRISGK